MTAPVTEDIAGAATKYLLTKPDLIAVVGMSDGKPWITRHALWKNFEGSQSTAIVVTSEGGWAGPNTHNTLRFPRLTVSVWGDPLRDQGNNFTGLGEVRARVNAVYEILDRYLHRPQGTSEVWSTIRTVSCIRLTEPDTFAVPNGDGVVRLQVHYAVTQG